MLHIGRTAAILCEENGSGHELLNQETHSQIFPSLKDEDSIPCFLVLCRDFGFDPLGLAEVPENFARYKESELIHCRWAMLAVVRITSQIEMI